MYWQVSKLTFDHCAHCRKSFSTYSLRTDHVSTTVTVLVFLVCSESCLFFFLNKGFCVFFGTFVYWVLSACIFFHDYFLIKLLILDLTSLYVSLKDDWESVLWFYFSYCLSVIWLVDHYSYRPCSMSFYYFILSKFYSRAFFTNLFRIIKSDGGDIELFMRCLSLLLKYFR